MYEYWTTFQRICASCPHHQIHEQLLIHYFYEGLISMDTQMIDATSGGALVDRTPVVARHLIQNMTSNNKVFSTRKNSIVLTSGIHEMGWWGSPWLPFKLFDLEWFWWKDNVYQEWSSALKNPNPSVWRKAGVVVSRRDLGRIECESTPLLNLNLMWFKTFLKSSVFPTKWKTTCCFVESTDCFTLRSFEKVENCFSLVD